MKFPQKLTLAIERARKSQLQLERETGIKQSSISAFTLDKQRPYLDQVFLLAKALGVSVEYFADDTQTDPSGSILTEAERLVLEAVRELGVSEAMRRLRGMAPSQAASLAPGGVVEVPLIPAGPPRTVRRDQVSSGSGDEGRDEKAGRKARRRTNNG